MVVRSSEMTLSEWCIDTLTCGDKCISSSLSANVLVKLCFCWLAIFGITWQLNHFNVITLYHQQPIGYL